MRRLPSLSSASSASSVAVSWSRNGGMPLASCWRLVARRALLDLQLAAVDRLIAIVEGEGTHERSGCGLGVVQGSGQVVTLMRNRNL